MREIILSQNQVALIDDDDYDRVSQYTWYAYYDNSSKTYYVQQWLLDSSISLHRFIMNPPKGMDVDHVDNNGLNNQRHNLRVCTRSQNKANGRKLMREASSNYKGVSWEKAGELWEANIRVNYKKIRLGRFISEIDAAKAYDDAAIKYFGEYSRTNFSQVAV